MKLDSLSPEHTVELAIGGMTCAACAARIERRLSKLDGVEASVNYATERAWVTGSQVLDLALLISTVENTGYQARTLDDLNDEPQDRSIDLERRLTLAIAFGTPVVLLSMVGGLQFDGWQWVTLGLALPVALWSGFPFHRSLVLNLRHGETTMDTLVSIGGTAKMLLAEGLPVTEVSEHTGFPEIMEGRVKTLHPKIHGGLLCRRDSAEHLAQAKQNDIALIDPVVVNLYPFEETVANPNVTFELAIEITDIGGVCP